MTESKGDVLRQFQMHVVLRGFQEGDCGSEGTGAGNRPGGFRDRHRCQGGFGGRFSGISWVKMGLYTMSKL